MMMHLQRGLLISAYILNALFLVALKVGADGEVNNTICAHGWSQHDPAVLSPTFSSTQKCAANQGLKVKFGDTVTQVFLQKYTCLLVQKNSLSLYS